MRQLKWMLYAGLLYTAATFAYFAVTSPVAFQKAVMLRPLPLALETPLQHMAPVAIRPLIARIPYRARPRTLYTVSPYTKHAQTILGGDGNCSNMAFGLAYHLSGHPYRIVHMLQPRSFLRGPGHTVVETTFTLDGHDHTGIVDVMGGGIPLADGRPLTLETLLAGKLEAPTLHALGTIRQELPPYYGTYLDSAVLGVLEGADVERYFRFLERFYFKVGPPFIDKIWWDGLAIVLGVYPPIRVTQRGYQKLFAEAQGVRFLAHSLLWAVRLLLPLGLCILLNDISKGLRTGRRGGIAR